MEYKGKDAGHGSNKKIVTVSSMLSQESKVTDHGCL